MRCAPGREPRREPAVGDTYPHVGRARVGVAERGDDAFVHTDGERIVTTEVARRPAGHERAQPGTVEHDAAA